MCADLVMRKRPAMHAGEMGLFIDTQVFEEEFASIKQGVDVSVEAKQSRNLKQMRLAWGLCRKIADSGALGDADTREVMNYLLKKAKHVKYIANQHRDGVEVEVIVKSIRFAAMEQTAFDRLFNRMLYIVTSEIIPEMPVGELRDLVEKLAGVETPEPAPPKRRGRPRRAEQLDHDPETGEVIEIPATEPVATAVHQGQPHPPASSPPGDAGTNSVPDAAAPAASVEEPASPSPAAIGKEAAPVSSKPINVPTWHAYCFAWLKEADDDDEINDVAVMTRWTAETKLRNSCGVVAEDRQQLFSFMNAIVAKKREAQAQRTR